MYSEIFVNIINISAVELLPETCYNNIWRQNN